jgi:subtilisin family serine protease
MTRRIAVSALFLFLAAQAYAASTERYIVAVRGIERSVGFNRDMDASVLRGRDVAIFSTLNAYAADLTAAEVAELRRSPRIRYVEAAVERHALELTAAAAETRNLAGQTVPFGVDLVHAREIWSVTRGAAINVVVIDTGVDYNHPDLTRVWAGGYNTITRNDDPRDDNGHGTHVAGTIAAADNNLGVIGVAPDVRLWAVKVLNAAGSGSSDKVVAAIDWIIGKKRDIGGNWVLNLSLGSNRPSIAEREAFHRAVEAGLLVVAASGNESEPGRPAAVSYPAAYDGVLAVGAVDSEQKIATFSNQGPELGVVAPGVAILSTIRIGTGSISGIQTTFGAFAASELTGSKKGSITGEVVDCGLGAAGDFPASVNGRIAMIRRGTITFAEKTRNAKAAGAAAVVIVNNDSSALSFTLLSDTDPSSSTFDWPVTVAVSKTDGEAILGRGGRITVANEKDDYGYLSGTSMASPHAAGVAALVWAADPRATAGNVIQSMTLTASDLGSGGFDTIFGNGLVNAAAAARHLAPGAFLAPGPPSGRRVLRRGR